MILLTRKICSRTGEFFKKWKKREDGGKLAMGNGDFFSLFKNKDAALIVGWASPGGQVDCELVLKRALLAIPRVCRFIFSAFT